MELRLVRVSKSAYGGLVARYLIGFLGSAAILKPVETWWFLPTSGAEAITREAIASVCGSIKGFML